MSGRGGKRPGAGRPKGAKDKYNFKKYWNEEEVEEFIAHCKELYKKNPKMCAWIGDHLFGKAVQPIGNEEGEKPLKIIVEKDNG